MTVVMMGEISLDDWDEKSEKKNGKDEVDVVIITTLTHVQRCSKSL